MKRLNIMIFAIIFFAVITMSIGYSALNAELSISGSAYVKADQSIRIISNEVKYASSSYATYAPTFTDNTITNHSTLEYGTSVLEYEIGIRNSTSFPYFIEDINELLDDNENIFYTIVGLSNYQEIKPGETIYFTLRLKMNRAHTIQSESLSIEFNFAQSYIFEDDVLNGADPELLFGMVPITYTKNGTIKKADINLNWYSYLDKEWANAVIVTEESRQNYDTAAPGTKINESDILGYYVWIPRFEYLIFNNTANAVDKTEIDIRFVTKDEPIKTSTQLNYYVTHPAFDYGGELLAGIWVGKFETTGTLTNPTILPNETSLKSPIKNLFDANLIFSGGTYEDNSSITYDSNIYYGLTASTESKMIQEDEWGAITILSSSKYGSDSIWNNSSTTTGCSGDSQDDANKAACINAFGTNSSGIYNQSTTGNIYGLFDTAGGAWEYTMGTYDGAISYSGFTSEFLLNNQKFYTYISSSYINNLGLTIDETKTWDGDLYVPTTSSIPWSIRGNNYKGGSQSGIYTVGNTRGNAADNGTRNVIINAPIFD